MVCPVCGEENRSTLCPECGFDSSRDYERYPTLAPVQKAPAVSALRKEWIHREGIPELEKKLKKKKKTWPFVAVLFACVILAFLFTLSRPIIVDATPSFEDLQGNLIDGYSAIGYYKVSTKILSGWETEVKFEVGEVYNGYDVLITGDAKEQPIFAIVSDGIVTAQIVPKGTYLLQIKTETTDGLNWSEWSEELPKGVDISSDTVQMDIMYRTRHKEFTTSTRDALNGWNLHETFVPETPYGEWSDWTETELIGNDYQETEEKKLYRFREKKYSSSTSPTMDGWTQYASQGNYTYGEWIGWTTTPVTPSSTLEVESITTYDYKFSVYIDGSYAYSESLEFFYDPGVGVGGVFDEGDVDGEYYQWIVASITENKQYKYRTITLNYVTYYFYQWTEWSDWGPEYKSGSDVIEVEEKSVYRVRDIYGEVAYRFWKWSDWSELTQERPIEGSNNELESCIVYRCCT